MWSYFINLFIYSYLFIKLNYVLWRVSSQTVDYTKDYNN